MEVVEACSALISNREVLDLLKANNTKRQSNLATILYETTSYLESSPVAAFSQSNLSEFLDTIKERKYDLTKIEKIQLTNLRPQNETELHLIVDNIEERFTEEQRMDLLQLIETMLNKPSEQDDITRKKLKQY